MKFRILAAVVIVCATASPSEADTVRLTVGQPLERFKLLKPGVRRYVRYTVNKDGSRTLIDVWQRSLSFEDDGKIGTVVHLLQRWDEIGSKGALVQDSYVRPSTFAPITHVRRLERDGKTQIGGYRFETGKVVGIGDLADNTRKDFVMQMPESSYNFEYDMELLQALPLAAGRTFNIPFYDAGVDPKPDRYRFVVAGNDKISGWAGEVVSCWLVTADYNTGSTKKPFLVHQEGPGAGSRGASAGRRLDAGKGAPAHGG